MCQLERFNLKISGVKTDLESKPLDLNFSRLSSNAGDCPRRMGGWTLAFLSK